MNFTIPGDVMTVGDLIEQLEKFPNSSKVFVDQYREGEDSELVYVTVREDEEGRVIIS